MNPTEIQPSPDPSRIERLKALHKLFEQWTLEDGQLSVEEADRLHLALEKDRGIQFRLLNLN